MLRADVDDDTFRNFVESWTARWEPGRRLLAGVSGGVDSVVLLQGLVRGGYGDVVVCHLNHGLRGAESEGDARFVRELAGRLGLMFEGGVRDVGGMARESGQSLETAGRVARQAFFAEAAQRHGCRRLMLGHHADDQAETILMNLCRGSAGLTGMSEETVLEVPGGEPLRVIRPLLAVRKADLLAVAEREGWEFREDASNASRDFVRNRVRHEVLPLLADIFQRDAEPGLRRAAEWTAEARGFLRECAAPWMPQERLPVKEVAALAPALRREVLAGWLRGRGVPDLSVEMVLRAERMLFPERGLAKWNLPGNRFLRRRAGWLWIESVPACGGEGG